MRLLGATKPSVFAQFDYIKLDGYHFVTLLARIFHE
jgi:hypothetical protein